MSEFKLVKHHGSIKDYQKEFDRIMTRLTILPKHAISGFITAYQLAMNTESQLHAQMKLTKNIMSSGGGSFQKGGYNPVFTKNTGIRKEPVANFNRKRSRRLTLPKLSEKRQKGLCFFSDEKFVSGHKCATSNRLYLLEVDEEHKVIVEDEPLETEHSMEQEEEKVVC
ncbi:hypothetical protein KY289_016804 [Solanum tuberosum]|nr:hypothetical protein KY289_016804 [Solanum tuberosum]